MKDYNFKNPADGSKTVLVRTNINILVGLAGKFVADYIQLHQGFQGFGEAENLTVTHQGEECCQRKLWDFQEGALFLLTAGPLPASLAGHKGYLWECEKCHRAATRKQQVRRVKCKHGGKHKFLFEEDNRSMVDKGRAKLTKPQYCPPGHFGHSNLDPAPAQLALAAPAAAPAQAAAAPVREKKRKTGEKKKPATSQEAGDSDLEKENWDALEYEWDANMEVEKLIEETGPSPAQAASPSNQVRFVHFGPFRHSNFQKSYFQHCQLNSCSGWG